MKFLFTLKSLSLIFPSNHPLFYLITNKLITQNGFISVSLNYGVLNTGALGALGRRFESCRPDSNNPSHRKVYQPSFFFAKILSSMDADKLRTKDA